MDMNILVTGCNGQLGSEIRQLENANSNLSFHFVDVEDLDITDELAVNRLFTNQHFDICINCAAYTAVDKAEADEYLAMQVNAIGPENLVKACNQNNALLIHVSTDFVFNGQASKPYSTYTQPSPINVYGASKAEGENRVLLLGKRAVVVRTSWVYSSFGANFVKTMIRLGKEKEQLNVVDDQIGQPTYARDLALAIIEIAKHSTSIDNGIIHYSNIGAIRLVRFCIRNHDHLRVALQG